MKKKERLDAALVNRALFPSRETARTAIMDGAILVDGQKVTKAGAPVAEEAKIEIIQSYNLCPYVSRGGLKLERGIQFFSVDPSGRTAVDAGASTGGFTDCLLKKGASFVYAVDVGYGQLDWSLRQDPRVKALERLNVRNLKKEELYGPDDTVADLAVMDVSFISVTKTLPALIELLSQNSFELIVLIKPQFEAGREKVGKNGVVRELSSHVEVLQSVLQFAADLRPLQLGLTYSPLKGPQGNIEYLLHIKGGENISQTTGQSQINTLAQETAAEAFARLGAP